MSKRAKSPVVKSNDLAWIIEQLDTKIDQLVGQAQELNPIEFSKQMRALRDERKSLEAERMDSAVETARKQGRAEKFGKRVLLIRVQFVLVEDQTKSGALIDGSLKVNADVGIRYGGRDFSKFPVSMLGKIIEDCGVNTESQLARAHQLCVSLNAGEEVDINDWSEFELPSTNDSTFQLSDLIDGGTADYESLCEKDYNDNQTGIGKRRFGLSYSTRQRLEKERKYRMSQLKEEKRAELAERMKAKRAKSAKRDVEDSDEDYDVDDIV